MYIVPDEKVWPVWLDVSVTLWDAPVTVTFGPNHCQLPFSKIWKFTVVATCELFVQLKLTEPLLIDVTERLLGAFTDVVAPMELVCGELLLLLVAAIS